MNKRITNELQSFLKDYAAEPTPRDSAIAQHFYDLALEDVKKEVDARYEDNCKASATAGKKRAVAAIFGAAAKEDFDIISWIDNQKQ